MSDSVNEKPSKVQEVGSLFLKADKDTGDDTYFTYIKTYDNGNLKGRTRFKIPQNVIDNAVLDYVNSSQPESAEPTMETVPA